MAPSAALVAGVGLLPAYLLGTFPSAILVARSKGVDITTVGSGNPGASNVARALGARWGLMVFALDGLKGALPAGAGLVFSQRPAAYAMVAAAALGHMFPVTRGWRGGKGVATVGGAMIVLHPLTCAVLLPVWYVTRRVTRTASVASLVVALALPVGVLIERSSAWELVATVALSLLVMVRHADNVKRLAQGTELSVSVAGVTGAEDRAARATAAAIRDTIADGGTVNDFNQQVIAEFRANGGKVGGPFEGAPMVLVTHRGAKSGIERTTPLVHSRDGDDVVIIASMGGAPTHPQWYHNMLANPEVTVEVGTETYRARVEEAVGAERDRLFAAQAALMPNFDEYQAKTTRVIPVLVLRRIEG